MDLELNDPALLRTDGYVGGRWIRGADRFAVTDPATGGTVARVARLDADAAREAVDVAHAAFDDWAWELPQVRAESLWRWFELIMQNRHDLARIMVAEQGKPLSEALGEIDYAASFVQFYAEEAKRPNIESVTSS